MPDRRLNDSLLNLEKAIENLEAALKIPSSGDLVIEGTIHRFEIAIQVFWKALSRALQYEGRPTYSPRECVREAFAYNWIDDEQAWLTMVDQRNLTTHEYLSEQFVYESYEAVRAAAPLLRKALDVLKSRYLI